MRAENFVPESLIEKYKSDVKAANLVNHLLEDAHAYIATASPRLFPEYTDHGPQHFKIVLETTRILIPDNVFEMLSAIDIACLVCGTILHDLGMFISIQSLMDLVSVKDRPIIGEIDSVPWSELWADHVNEVRQYSEEQCEALYGRTEQIDGFPDRADDWTNIHCLCAGEFVRKYHPRMAHEIPIFGIPQFISNFSPDKYGDIAGIIGRSHGHQLRDFFEYLDNKYGNYRRPGGITCIYLMGLLRVADFLDLDYTRAAGPLFKNHRFSSPVSEREWKLHNIIDGVETGVSDDPEAILVHAIPDSADKFLHIERTLGYLQKELDHTWAVLGEVYGGQTTAVYSPSGGATAIPLNQLALTIRRVKSNLTKKHFLDNLKFEPTAAKFETAGSSLLNLLIDPLYGKHPEVGIRELMQNAIDATREMTSIDSNDNRAVTVTLEQNEDILIFTIIDEGVGMTLNTILNHFLNIGSSLRRTSEWKKSYAKNGKSDVLRSGRFGIGVLAAFLLGDKIHVQTRHYTEGTGYIFETKLHATNIQLDRSTEIPVGTKIEITLIQEKFNVLLNRKEHWDWYCDQWPMVNRFVNREQQIQTKTIHPDKLYVCEHEDFEHIYWTYKDSIAQLTCNGLVIAGLSTIAFVPKLSLDAQVRSDKSWDYDVIVPKLAIFDKNALLPLNLTRDQLTDDVFSFCGVLLEEIKYHFIAHYIKSSRQMDTNGETVYVITKNDTYKGIAPPKNLGNRILLSNWGMVESGYIFKDYWHLKSANISKILVIPQQTTRLMTRPEYGDEVPIFTTNKLLDTPVFGETKEGLMRRPNGDANFINQTIAGQIFGNIVECFGNNPVQGCRILLSKTLLEQITAYSLSPSLAQATIIEHSEYLVQLEIGICSGESLLSNLTESEERKHNERFCVIECHLIGYRDNVPLSPFAEAWSDVFVNAYMSQDMELRPDIRDDVKNKVEYYCATDY